MDIKELKILDIRNGNSQVGVADLGPASSGYCGRNGRGGAPGAPLGSAPVAVPRKGELRSQEGLSSPQQCSKSYGERHLEAPGQTKGFRRRHNSCEYHVWC